MPEVIRHLGTYAERVVAPGETNTTVLSVRGDHDGYRIATTQGEWRCPTVVAPRSSLGGPSWRVHVAMKVAGNTELAVVTAPALGRRWWATRGGGSFESCWPREKAEARRLEISTIWDRAVFEIPGRCFLCPRHCPNG